MNTVSNMYELYIKSMRKLPWTFIQRKTRNNLMTGKENDGNWSIERSVTEYVQLNQWWNDEQNSAKEITSSIYCKFHLNASNVEHWRNQTENYFDFQISTFVKVQGEKDEQISRWFYVDIQQVKKKMNRRRIGIIK